jgi:putative hemolysin
MNMKIFKKGVKKRFSIFLLCATVITLLIAVSVGPALALRDPAAVYCEALGYNYTIESTGEGQRGFCQLPNDQTVDAGEFLQGKVAQEYSYCQQMGYEIRTLTDSEKCSSIYTDECAVCVLEDGMEAEVTELMGLTFWTGVCGDGVCGYPEDSETCPEDCLPSEPGPPGLSTWIWVVIGLGSLAVLGAALVVTLKLRHRGRGTTAAG